MIKKNSQVSVVIVAIAVMSGITAGCSFSAGDPTVSQHDVETKVATTLAKQVNQPTPTVVCPGDLDGKVGTVMYCSLTPKGDTASYPVQVKVTSVKGTDVNFHLTVSTTTGHFTAPS